MHRTCGYLFICLFYIFSKEVGLLTIILNSKLDQLFWSRNNPLSIMFQPQTSTGFTACLQRFVWFFVVLSLFFDIGGRQASVKAQEELTTWQIFYHVERRFHNRESNHQPLP